MPGVVSTHLFPVPPSKGIPIPLNLPNFMITQLSRALLLSTSLLLLAACSNVGEKRTLLAAAGFNTIPATTPAQIARLQGIKSSKVVPMSGKKGTVYIFADKAKNSLIVGSPAQYQQYRSLKLKHQRAEEQLLDAQVNMDNADYNAWGPTVNWGWCVASYPL